jgi:hypothetical protein
MLAKLRQLEFALGFVHLMYHLVEVLGKVVEFMLPSGSAVCGNSRQLLPVRAQNSLMQVRAHRYRWTSWDLSRTGRTRHLDPASHPFPWSPYSE